MKLQYEISVISGDAIKRATRGIESTLRAHARTTQAITRNATGSTKPQKPSDFARGMDQIGRAARAADLRAARERIALDKRVEVQRIAGIKRTEAAQLRAIQRTAAAEARAARQVAAQRTRTAQSVSRGIAGSATRGFRSVAGLGAGMVGIGGGFAVHGAIQSQMSATAAASNLANQAGRPELKGSLLKQMQSQKGMDADQAAAGASAFQALAGDIDATQRALPMLSQLAIASGADIADLGAAAGSAFAQIRRDVSDPIVQMEKLAEVMRLVAAQGQEGAIEIRDLGREMPRLAGVASKFGPNKDKNLGGMAAFAQIAVERGGAANAAQAVSGVEAMVRQLGARGADLEKMGVGVFSRQGKKRTGLLDPTETIISTLHKTGGDIPKLQKIFGEEGMRGLEGLRSTFVESGGGAKGEAAVRELFKRFSKTMSQGDVEKRFSSRMADPDMEFKEQVKAFNVAVGKRLLPVVTDKLIPAMAKLAPPAAQAAEVLAGLAKSFADNPIAGVGVIIGAAIAKDIAAAAVGKVAAKSLEKVISSLSGIGGRRVPVGAGAPAAGAAGGRMAAAGTGLAVGAVAALTIYAAGVQLFNESEASMARGGKDVRDAESSEDPGHVRALLGAARSRRRELGEEAARSQGWFGTAKNFVTGRDQTLPVEQKTQEGFIERLEARLAMLEKAAGSMEAAAQAGREGAVALQSAAGASNRTTPIGQR